MVKHTQTIRRLLQTNFLSVFDHFVGSALKGLMNYKKQLNDAIHRNENHRIKITFIFCFSWKSRYKCQVIDDFSKITKLLLILYNTSTVATIHFDKPRSNTYIFLQIPLLLLLLLICSSYLYVVFHSLLKWDLQFPGHILLYLHIICSKGF